MVGLARDLIIDNCHIQLTTNWSRVLFHHVGLSTVLYKPHCKYIVQHSLTHQPASRTCEPGPTHSLQCSKYSVDAAKQFGDIRWRHKTKLPWGAGGSSEQTLGSWVLGVEIYCGGGREGLGGHGALIPVVIYNINSNDCIPGASIGFIRVVNSTRLNIKVL